METTHALTKCLGGKDRVRGAFSVGCNFCWVYLLVLFLLFLEVAICIRNIP